MAMTYLYFASTISPLLSVVPFTVYSTFHTITYFRTVVLTTLYTPTPATRIPLANYLGNWIKNYYDPSMNLVALVEVCLWFNIVFGVVLLPLWSRGGFGIGNDKARGSEGGRGGRWMLLCMHTIFLRLRYGKNEFVQDVISRGTRALDVLFAKDTAPEMISDGWCAVKDVVSQVYEGTAIDWYEAMPRGKPIDGDGALKKMQ